MAFIKWLTYIISIFIVQIIISQIAFGESDDVYYVAQFNDKIMDCDDFENKVILLENIEVVFGSETEGQDGGYKLFGQINLMEPITKDYDISLMTYKDHPGGKEFMYAVRGNICESLKKPDTPWYPLLETFNTSECPIEPGIYSIDNLVISLNFAKGALSQELCGDYSIEMEVQTGIEQVVSCFIVAMEVLEKTY